MLKTKFEATISNILITKNDSEAEIKSRLLNELGLKKYYRRIGLFRGEFLYVLTDDDGIFEDFEVILNGYRIDLHKIIYI